MNNPLLILNDIIALLVSIVLLFLIVFLLRRFSIRSQEKEIQQLRQENAELRTELELAKGRTIASDIEELRIWELQKEKE